MFHLQHLFSTLWKLLTWGLNWQIVTTLLMENKPRNFPSDIMKWNFKYLSVVISDNRLNCMKRKWT